MGSVFSWDFFVLHQKITKKTWYIVKFLLVVSLLLSSIKERREKNKKSKQKEEGIFLSFWLFFFAPPPKTNSKNSDKNKIKNNKNNERNYLKHTHTQNVPTISVWLEPIFIHVFGIVPFNWFPFNDKRRTLISCPYAVGNVPDNSLDPNNKYWRLCDNNDGFVFVIVFVVFVFVIAFVLAFVVYTILLPISIGNVPENWLKLKFIDTKSEHWPISVGIVPLNWFDGTSNSFSVLLTANKPVGSCPSNWFWPTINRCNDDDPIVVGSVPDNWFCDSIIFLTFVKFPNSVGMVPISWFWDRSKWMSFSNWPISAGIVPSNLLLPKFNTYKLVADDDVGSNQLGIVPIMLLSKKSISFNVSRLASSDGIVPPNALFSA